MTAGIGSRVAEQVRREAEREWSKLASERALLRRVYAPELSLDVLALSDLINKALDERMDASLLGNAKGMAHRLRCNAAACEFPSVSAAAERVEDILQGAIRGRPSADAWFVVMRSLREMRAEIRDAEEEGEPVEPKPVVPEVPLPPRREISVEEALSSLASDDVPEETWEVVERALGDLGSLGGRAVEAVTAPAEDEPGEAALMAAPLEAAFP